MARAPRRLKTEISDERRENVAKIANAVEFINSILGREAIIMQVDEDLPPKTVMLTSWSPAGGDGFPPGIYGHNTRLNRWISVERAVERVTALAYFMGMDRVEGVETSRPMPSQAAANEVKKGLPPPPPKDSIPPRPDAAPPDPSEADTITLPGGDEIVLL